MCFCCIELRGTVPRGFPMGKHWRGPGLGPLHCVNAFFVTAGGRLYSLLSMQTNEAMASTLITDEYLELSRSFGSEAIDDPHPVLRELRKSTSVLPENFLARYGLVSETSNSPPSRPTFTVLRHAEVSRALQDPATFSVRIVNETQGIFLEEDIWFSQEGAAHRDVRKILAPLFTPASLKRWNDDLISPAVRALLAPLLPLGQADLVRDYALVFPTGIIFSFLGYPEDRSLQEKLTVLALRVLSGPQADPERRKVTAPLALEAGRAMYQETLAAVLQRQRQGASSDDLISKLLHPRADGQVLDHASIIRLVRPLLLAAAETTSRSFSNLLQLLLERPAVLDRVRNDRSLVPAAVHESMRLEPTALFLLRSVERDTELGGISIPAGAVAILATGSASRDEGVYEDPDTFDIGRPMRPHFGFGFGTHACLGMHIAKLELHAALNAVLDLMPGIRFDPNRPVPKIVGLNLRAPKDLPVVWNAQ
jgi:cytochrome P450